MVSHFGLLFGDRDTRAYEWKEIPSPSVLLFRGKKIPAWGLRVSPVLCFSTRTSNQTPFLTFKRSDEISTHQLNPLR